MVIRTPAAASCSFCLGDLRPLAAVPGLSVCVYCSHARVPPTPGIRQPAAVTAVPRHPAA
jgi:hypothetical protein